MVAHCPQNFAGAIGERRFLMIMGSRSMCPVDQARELHALIKSSKTELISGCRPSAAHRIRVPGSGVDPKASLTDALDQCSRELFMLMYCKLC